MGETPMAGGEEIIDRASHAGNWKVLSNGRLGLPLPLHRTGRQIYLATDGVSRLCLHGEKASRIAMVNTGARKRNGECDCQNLDGLTTRHRQLPAEWEVPRYYDVLVANGADEVALPRGRAGRRICHNTDTCNMVMLPCGDIRCVHGNAESTLMSHHRHVAPQGIEADPPATKTHAKRQYCSCRIGKRGWRRRCFQNR